LPFRSAPMRPTQQSNAASVNVGLSIVERNVAQAQRIGGAGNGRILGRISVRDVNADALLRRDKHRKKRPGLHPGVSSSKTDH
jgi:hypothetical protein